ncbi:hypothetical protein CHUAL_008350 [Chamberlinius hualienensis]
MNKEHWPYPSNYSENAAKVQIACSMVPANFSFAVLYFLILLIAFPGNMLVILQIISKPKLYTASNIYMLSYSLASLLLCLFTITLTPFYSAIQVWLLGPIMCSVFAYIESVAIYMFSLGSLAISIDCFNSLFQPDTVRAAIKKSQWVLLLVILVSTALSVFIALFAEVVKYKGKKVCVWLWANNYYYSNFIAITVAMQYVFPFALANVYNFIIRYKLWTTRFASPRISGVSILDRESVKRRTLVVTVIEILLLPYQLLTVEIFLFSDYRLISWLGIWYFMFKSIVIAISSIAPFLFVYVNNMEIMELLDCLPESERWLSTKWFHFPCKKVVVTPNLNTRNIRV